MTNFSHLDACELRLSHERVRLANARTASERAIREVWVAQCEREIAGERRRLGLDDDAAPMSDDDLLAALAGLV
jgi:hypothetical protein